MGSRKPSATYVHERNGKVVYAREFGALPETRQVVDWEYDPENTEFKTWSKKFIDEYTWNDILLTADKTPALQDALERVKVIYYLTKEKNGT